MSQQKLHRLHEIHVIKTEEVKSACECAPGSCTDSVLSLRQFARPVGIGVTAASSGALVTMAGLFVSNEYVDSIPAGVCEPAHSDPIRTPYRRTRARDRREGSAETTFEGRYPVGRVAYRDDACPVEAKLEASSLLSPLNVDDSSLPATVMSFRVKNASDAIEQQRDYGTMGLWQLGTKDEPPTCAADASS